MSTNASSVCPMQINLLTEKNKILAQRLSDCSTEYKALISKTNMIELENKSLKQSLQKYNELNIKYTELSDNFKSLTQSMYDLQEDYDKISASNIELEQNYKLSQKKVNKQTDIINAMIRDKSHLESQNLEINEQLLHLSSIINNQDIIISNLKQELALKGYNARKMTMSTTIRPDRSDTIEQESKHHQEPSDTLTYTNTNLIQYYNRQITVDLYQAHFYQKSGTNIDSEMLQLNDMMNTFQPRGNATSITKEQNDVESSLLEKEEKEENKAMDDEFSTIVRPRGNATSIEKLSTSKVSNYNESNNNDESIKQKVTVIPEMSIDHKINDNNSQTLKVISPNAMTPENKQKVNIDEQKQMIALASLERGGLVSSPKSTQKKKKKKKSKNKKGNYRPTLLTISSSSEAVGDEAMLNDVSQSIPIGDSLDDIKLSDDKGFKFKVEEKQKNNFQEIQGTKIIYKGSVFKTARCTFGPYLQEDDKFSVYFDIPTVGSGNNYQFGFASQLNAKWSVPMRHAMMLKGNGILETTNEFCVLNNTPPLIIMDKMINLFDESLQINTIVISVNMKTQCGYIWNDNDTQKRITFKLPESVTIVFIFHGTDNKTVIVRKICEE